MHSSIIEFQFKKKLNDLDISLKRYEENTKKKKKFSLSIS
jgi:hypothetical protein